MAIWISPAGPLVENRFLMSSSPFRNAISLAMISPLCFLCLGDAPSSRFVQSVPLTGDATPRAAPLRLRRNG